MPNCELCGEPMPPGEEMFKIHGYSGDCPKPPKPRPKPPDFAAIAKRFAENNTMLRKIVACVPDDVLAAAKDAAGVGDADLSLNDPRLDEAWLQFISTPAKEQQ